MRHNSGLIASCLVGTVTINNRILWAQNPSRRATIPPNTIQRRERTPSREETSPGKGASPTTRPRCQPCATVDAPGLRPRPVATYRVHGPSADTPGGRGTGLKGWEGRELPSPNTGQKPSPVDKPLIRLNLEYCIFKYILHYNRFQLYWIKVDESPPRRG